MIKRIEIEGFQSHLKTEVDLSGGVNVFIGANDAGKTAILRAMTWLITNRPSGDAFKNPDADTVACQVVLQDDMTISRSKSKDGNLYSVDGQLLEGFGQEVPEEVRQALRIEKVNLQTQFEPHFLLSQSPGEVAKVLSQAVKLDEIDAAHANINRTIRDAERLAEEKEGAFASHKEVLKQYAFLPEMEKDVVKARQLEDQLAQRQSEVAALGKLVRLLSDQEVDLQQAESVLGLKPDLDRAFDLHRSWEKVEKERGQLARLIATAKDLERQQKEAQEKTDTLEEEWHKLMPDVCPLCGRSK